MSSTRTCAVRHALLAVLFVSAAPTALPHGAPSDTVQYVGGSAKSIPVNTTGSFNFEDSGDFRFVYGPSIFKLPYAQITSTNIENVEVKRALHVFPKMSPIADHRKQMLTLTFTDSKGVNGTLSFELMAYRAAEAKDMIAAKKITPAEAAAASNEWWGDAIWKTKRNQAMWDARAAQVAESQRKAQEAAAAQATAQAPTAQAANAPIPAADTGGSK